MRHQLPRETSQSNNPSGAGTSSSTMGGGGENLPGTSGSSASSVTIGDNRSPTSSSSSSGGPMGPPPSNLTTSSTTTPTRGSKPYSVIRTQRQLSMVGENSGRSSYASPSSSSTTALISNLEAVHSAEMKNSSHPANIVRHVVEELGNIIKEMREDNNSSSSRSAAVSGGAGFAENVSNSSDVEVLRQRLITVERANHMMTIHFDLYDLQKRLEVAETVQLDERKSWIIATREELYKEIVELLEAEFSCSICHLVFVSPATTKCGHTFCELCIKTWTRDKVDCPICRCMVFNDYGRNIEIDNFITRLHLRLSDEIRQGREALVQERVQALETLRTTPRRNEGAAFVEALRFLRDQQHTPTTARALAERFRQMRRSAAEANIDDVVVSPSISSAATASPAAPASNNDRIRQRLRLELGRLYQHRQQQSQEPLDILSPLPLSRAGSSSGRQPSASSSSSSSPVARIRVRPSQGVSFTLVAPRSMIPSQQTTSAPAAVSSSPNQSMIVRSQITEPQPASVTTTTTGTTLNTESQLPTPEILEQRRRAHRSVLMARYASRSGLERAVAHARSQLSTTTTPSSSAASTTPASQRQANNNNSRNENDVEMVDVDVVGNDVGSAANAARRIRSIFSGATSTAAAPMACSRDDGVLLANEDNLSSPSSPPLPSVPANYPSYNSSPSFRRLARQEANDNQQQQQHEGSDALQDQQSSSITSASAEIIRAFSENSNLVENNNFVETTPDLEELDQRLITEEVALHNAISAYRAMTDSDLNTSGGSSTPPPLPTLTRQATTPQQTENSEIIVPYDVGGEDDVMGVSDTAQQQNLNNTDNVNDNNRALLLAVQRSRRNIRPGVAAANEHRPVENRVLLHRIRESRRRRGERPHHHHRGESSTGSSSGHSRNGRERETTITISFCRGDQDRNNGNTNNGGGDPAENSPPSLSGCTPSSTTSSSVLSQTPPRTSSLVSSDVPLLPIIMDCDSDDTPSSPAGPSTIVNRRGENIDDEEDSSLLTNNEVQITGDPSSAAASGYNSTSQQQAVDDDIEILFSDTDAD